MEERRGTVVKAAAGAMEAPSTVSAARVTADQPSIAALYAKHGTTLRRVAASILREKGMEAQAGDVVNNVFLSIMTSPPREDVRNWQAFLVHAVQRRTYDAMTTAEVRHRASASIDDVRKDVPGVDNADIAEAVAERLDLSRRAELARSCFNVLSDRQRHVIVQGVIEGRPRGEVAAELGVSPARISQIKTEALELLRDEMLRREEKANGSRRA